MAATGISTEMKEPSKTITGVFVVQWFEFPTGNRAFGGGGWSRSARHRPAPEKTQKRVTALEFKGKSIIVEGQRKLRLNIYDAIKREWIRVDYPELKEDLQFHADLHLLVARAKSSRAVSDSKTRVIDLK